MNPENKDLKQPKAGDRNWPFNYKYFDYDPDDPTKKTYIPMFWGDNQFVDPDDPFKYNPPTDMLELVPLTIPKSIRFFRSEVQPSGFQTITGYSLSGVGTTVTTTASFANDSGSGNIILVGVIFGDTNSAAIATVTDSLGTTYTLVDIVGGGAITQKMAVYYGFTTSDGPNTVSVVINTVSPGTPSVRLICAEYPNVLSFIDFVSNAQQDTNLATSTITAGELVPAIVPADLYVAFYSVPNVISLSGTYDISDGFSIKESLIGFPPGGGGAGIFVDSDDPPIAMPGPNVEPSLTWSIPVSVLSGSDLIIAVALER